MAKYYYGDEDEYSERQTKYPEGKAIVKIADSQANSHLTLPSYPIIRQFQSVEGDEGLQIPKTLIIKLIR